MVSCLFSCCWKSPSVVPDSGDQRVDSGRSSARYTNLTPSQIVVEQPPSLPMAQISSSSFSSPVVQAVEMTQTVATPALNSHYSAIQVATSMAHTVALSTSSAPQEPQLMNWMVEAGSTSITSLERPLQVTTQILNANVQTVTTSNLPVIDVRNDLSHSTLIRKDELENPLVFKILSSKNIFLIGEFLSCRQWVTVKTVNRLWNQTLGNPRFRYYEGNTISFHQINRYVEEARSLFNPDKDNLEKVFNSVKIDALIDHLIEECDKNPMRCSQKLNWFLWKFQTSFDWRDPMIQRIMEAIQHKMLLKRLISYPDLMQYVHSYQNIPIEPKNINWNLINVRIVMDYYQSYNTWPTIRQLPSELYIVEELVQSIFRESLVQISEGDKTFIQTFFDSAYTDLGRKVCQKVFSALEKSREISHEDLIRAFSVEAIKKFSKHSSSMAITRFTISKEITDLSDIISLLKSGLKLILRISVLKVKTGDLPILQKINFESIDIVCHQIVVEDKDASEEEISNLINGLRQSNLLSKSKDFNFSNTKLTLQALQSVMEGEEITELKFENCSTIDLHQLEELESFSYFSFNQDKCILKSLFGSSFPANKTNIRSIIVNKITPQIHIEREQPKICGLFDKLPSDIKKMISSNLSFRDLEKVKGVNSVFGRLDEKFRSELNTSTFSRITSYVEGIKVIFNKEISHKKNTYEILRRLIEKLGICSCVDYLTEICKKDPVHQPKLDWLFWKLSTCFEYKFVKIFINRTFNMAPITTQLRTLVNSAGLKIFNNTLYPTEITWDFINVRIMMTYSQDFFSFQRNAITHGEFEDLIKFIVEKCLDRFRQQESQLKKIEFMRSLVDSTYTDFGHEICKKVFSEVQIWEEVSHHDLIDLIPPNQTKLELYCNQHSYTDMDLGIIRTLCPKLTQVILRSPSFSGNAINRFLNDPSSAVLTHFEIQNGEVNLSDITSFLTRPNRPNVILKISTLKIKASDHLILKSQYVENIKCQKIIVEDSTASSLAMKELIHSLTSSGLLKEVVNLNCSNTQLGWDTLNELVNFMLEKSLDLKLMIANCSNIDVNLIDELESVDNFVFFKAEHALMSQRGFILQRNCRYHS